jgi:hypothetical protein
VIEGCDGTNGTSFAALFGRVMPFRMVSSTMLNLVLLLPFERLNAFAWHLSAMALFIQVMALLFSLIGPVPINQPIITSATQ